jgi:hypothetical protein
VEYPDLDSISERCIEQTAYGRSYTDGEFFRGEPQERGQWNDGDEGEDKDKCRTEVSKVLYIGNKESKGQQRVRFAIKLAMRPERWLCGF